MEDIILERPGEIWGFQDALLSSGLTWLMDRKTGMMKLLATKRKLSYPRVLRP